MSLKKATDSGQRSGKQSATDSKRFGVQLLANVLIELSPLGQPFLVFSGSWALLLKSDKPMDLSLEKGT